MHKIFECCICLDTNKENYTDYKAKTICKHPVCSECYIQMIDKVCVEYGKSAKCPLCRCDIKSIEIEVSQAVSHIKNVTYECIAEPNEFEYCLDVIVDEDGEIWFLDDDDVLPGMTKKQEISQYFYLKRDAAPARRRSHIRKYKKQLRLRSR